jgi:hypothetical protein
MTSAANKTRNITAIHAVWNEGHSQETMDAHKLENAAVLARLRTPFLLPTLQVHRS